MSKTTSPLGNQSNGSEKNTSTPWHGLGTDEVLSMLKTSSQTGLSSKEAAKRFKQYGYNEIQAKKKKALSYGSLSSLKIL